MIGAAELIRFLIAFKAAKSAGGLLGWATRLVRSSLSKKGLLVYFLGPDGAGKTTFAETLLEHSIVRDQISYYHGRIPALPRAGAIVGKSPDKPKYGSQNKRSFGLLHCLYYSFDAVLLRGLLMFRLRRDELIISDRSFFDIVAREQYREIPRIFRWALVNCTPAPDYCFLMTAPPNEIHRRKPELPTLEIEQQYLSYKAYTREFKIIELETTVLEDTHQQFCKALSR